MTQMSKIHRVDQGTEEWHRLRIGMPTASNFDKIITPKTGKPSTQARGYMYRLIAERLLNEQMEDTTGRMEWVERGKIEQPHAAAQLEFTYDLKLEPVGFVTTDDGRLGCSPDMLVVDRPEAVEIKCPAPWTQIGYLLDGLGDDYRPQVQGQILIGEFERVHFYSWHPRMPPFYRPTNRDDRYIRILEPLLHAFLDELEHETERARGMGSYAAFVRHIERLDPLWAV
jgi:hypothetical protein